MQILFCIDKARQRSFTEVALNSVLEENAIDQICMGILLKFLPDIYSPV